MSQVHSLPSPAELLAALVALPAPPGQEGAVRDYLAAQLDTLALPHRTDAKGNLLTCPGGALPERPRVVVTAHMDEIALLVTGHGFDIEVAPLGGLFPWKWGEGPVEILPLAGGEPVPAILGFGSIHTTSPRSVAQAMRDGKSVSWADISFFTGLPPEEQTRRGIGVGSRVVMARERRRVQTLGKHVGAYFLDDRADCVAWLLALAELKTAGIGAEVLFVATTSEEVGGEGAQYALRSLPAPPDVCVALEIGPHTPDAPLSLTAHPSVWITDTYAAMAPGDIAAVIAAGRSAGLAVQTQAVTRGGSDATIAATRGLCARPVTLAFAADNSHGFEIMHRDAPESLGRLLVTYLSGMA